MATKKAPSKAQLAARKKFVEMVRAKAKAKKTATKKAPVKKVSELYKVVRRGKKTDVIYSRVSGVGSLDMYSVRDSIEKQILQTTKGIENLQKLLPTITNKMENKKQRILIIVYKKHLMNLKTTLRNQNKLISDLLK